MSLWKPSKIVKAQINRGDKKDREWRKALAERLELEFGCRQAEKRSNQLPTEEHTHESD